MASEILVGNSSSTGSGCTGSYFYLGRFQAVKSKTGATEFRVYAGSSGNVKVAVYADSSGEPGALLGYNNTSQAVVAGWNTLTVSSVDIVSGTYYWLAVNTDGGDRCRRDSAGGTIRYKAATYSSFTFPDPAGSGFTSSTYLITLAVWGEAGTYEELSSNVDGVGSADTIIGRIRSVSGETDTPNDMLSTLLKYAGISSITDSAGDLLAVLGKIREFLSTSDIVTSIDALLETEEVCELMSEIDTQGDVQSSLQKILSLISFIDSTVNLQAVFDSGFIPPQSITAPVKIKYITSGTLKAGISAKLYSQL